MPHHVLDMPVGDAQVRGLKVGDTVTLEKTLFGIRDATLIAMFDRGRTTRFDLRGHAVVHTAPNVRKVDPRAEQRLPGTSRCASAPPRRCAWSSFTRPLMTARRRRAHHHRQGRHGTGHARRASATSAAPIWRWSAARQRCRPPGSRRSKTSTWTTCIPRSPVEVPHQGFRPAAGDDGFARRARCMPTCNAAALVTARRGAGEAGCGRMRATSVRQDEGQGDSEP